MRHLLLNTVANVDDATTGYPSPEALPEGQIGVFDVASGSNLNLTGDNSTASMIIAQGVANGGTPVKTNILESNLIHNVNVRAYAAPQRQITHVGFNGTDGSIEAGAGTYTLKTVDLTKGYQPNQTHNITYVAKDGDTSFDIAKGLVKAAQGNLTGQGGLSVSAQLVADITTAAPSAGATASVVEGSDVIEVSVATGITVGDYLRIGSAADAGDPIYVVKSIDGTTVVLESAYTGDSDPAAVIGVGSTAADANTLAGIQLSGDLPDLSNEEGIAKFVKDQVTSFRTALSEEFGATTVRATQSPEFGSGSPAQVEALEQNTQYADGFLYRATVFGGEKPNFYTDPSLTYDLITIQYRTNTTENIAKSNKYLEIVLAVRAGQGATMAAFFNGAAA